MYKGERETDISRNLRMIDWLRAELVSTVGLLLKAMAKGSQELILDALAGGMIVLYVLGRRLGLTFSRIDLKVAEKLREGIALNHETEIWYKDLSSLLVHLEGRKR
ncbi:MAG: hypothetical protein GX779_02110 [Clostridia bacterium]|nr:hypothetical protein [Clostridia bacterium]